MTLHDPNLTICAELADELDVPERIDGWPDVVHIAGHPYRVEAWHLADGGNAVVVRGLVNAPSFVNEWKPVADFVDERWGKDTLIIEDWGQKGLFGHRFHIMSRDGGNSVVNDDELRERGIVLTTNLYQEP